MNKVLYKTLLVALLLLAFGSKAKAMPAINIEGGATLNWFYNLKVYDESNYFGSSTGKIRNLTSPLPGYWAGVSVYGNLYKNIDWQAQAGYTLLESRLKLLDYKMRYSQPVISFAFMANYPLAYGIITKAGPQCYLPLEKLNIDYLPPLSGDFDIDYTQRATWGLQAGIGYTVNAWTWDLQYVHSLDKINAGYSEHLRPRALRLIVGYAFF